MKAAELEKQLKELLTYTDTRGRIYFKGRVLRYNEGLVTLFLGDSRYEELKEELEKFGIQSIKSLNNNKHITYRGEV